MSSSVFFVLGTRPDAIKMAPLIRAAKESGVWDKVLVCNSSQHKEMLQPVLDFFEIEPDFDLDVMRKDQTLSELLARMLSSLGPILAQVRPQWLFVQGDTSSALAGALAGFYAGIKVVHVEAGLRTGDPNSPFPEEMHRVAISRLATVHCAPTDETVSNLASESIIKNVINAGNTGIDAVRLARKSLQKKYAPSAVPNSKFVLVTLHRRENFGDPLQRICEGIKLLAIRNPECSFVFPVHLNPKVQDMVYSMLEGIPNVILRAPIDYPEIIWYLDRCLFVLTDSGGLQEEAPSFRKPTLVARKSTERPDAVRNGFARLIGSDKELLVEEAQKLLSDEAYYRAMQPTFNPFGDGYSSQRILAFLSDCDAVKE